MSKSIAIAVTLSILTAISVTDCLAESKNSKKKSEAQPVKAKPKSKSNDKDLKKGGELFSSNCASCHPAGGNKVTPSKPVKGSWTLAALSTFKSYLNQPIGTMPHYDHIISDEKNLKLLYEYVKKLDSDGAAKKSRSI